MTNVLALKEQIAQLNKQIAAVPEDKFSPEEPTREQLQEITSAVKRHLKALGKLETHGDGVCSHFGVGISAGGVSMNIGEQNGRLFIYVERASDVRWRKTNHGTTVQVGLSKFGWGLILGALHQAVKSPLLDNWNGAHDHTSGSFVFKKWAPNSLRDGIHNYRSLKDCFAFEKNQPRFDTFRNWLDKRLEMVDKGEL